MGNSSNGTFANLSAKCSESVYSSPRVKVDKDYLAKDRVMPFDFVTHRKAKMFFKEEPLLDLDVMLHDKN